MSPHVTIGLGSSRPGGLDISLKGLVNQTYEDFELILVDSRYHKRHAQVLDYVKELGLKQPFYHVPNQRYTEEKHSTNCSAVNTGFMLGEGDIYIMLLDYAYTPPHWIERHLKYHDKKRQVYAPHIYYDMPVSKVRTIDEKEPVIFPLAAPKDIPLALAQRERYNEISIFDSPFNVSDILEDKAILSMSPHQDPKVGMPEGVVNYTWMHTKNESFPLQVVLEIGGIDEYYDIGTGPGDTDFGYRLMMAGCEPYLAPSAAVLCVNPRSLFPRICPSEQSLYDQGENRMRQRMNEMRKSGSYKSTNNYNMLEKRKELLEWKVRSQEREPVLPYNLISDKEWYPNF